MDAKKLVPGNPKSSVVPTSLKRVPSSLSTPTNGNSTAVGLNAKQQRDADKLYLRFGDTVSFRIDGLKESGCLTAQGFADTNVLLRPCPMTEVILTASCSLFRHSKWLTITDCIFTR